MRGLLTFLVMGVFGVTAQAAPLLINGTGGLTPLVEYSEGEPLLGNLPSLTFIEYFADIPASLNVEGASDYIQLTLSAPTDYEFTVAADTVMSVGFYYTSGTGPNVGFTMASPVQVSFIGLEGLAPTFSDFSSVWSQGFAFSLNTAITETFSFTSMVLTMAISGTGLNSTVSDNGDHQISVSQNPYTGEAPPDETPLFAVTPVPEPSYSLIGIAGLGALLALRRKRQVGLAC